MAKILFSLVLFSLFLGTPAHATKDVMHFRDGIVQSIKNCKGQQLKDKALLDAIAQCCNFPGDAPLIQLLQEFKRSNNVIGMDFVARAIASNNKELMKIVNNSNLQDLRPLVARFYYLLNGYSLKGVDEESYSFSLQDYVDYQPKIFRKDRRYNGFSFNFWGLRLNSLCGLENVIKLTLCSPEIICSLDLLSNHFTHVPEELKMFPHLKDLWLVGNRITALRVGCFDGLPDLEMIELAANRITYLEEGTFDGLHKLNQLYLSGNQIAKIDENVFKDLSSLLYLSLDNNSLVEVPTAVKWLNKLEQLALSNNKINHINNGDFEGLYSLKDLNIGCNPMSEISLAVFNGLNIKNLYIGDRLTTQIEIEGFQGLPALKFLRIFESHLNEENKVALKFALPDFILVPRNENLDFYCQA